MMDKNNGFSIIELMTVVVIIAVMALAAFAIFKNFRERTSVKVAARDVVNVMRLARRKAVTERTNYLAVYDLENEKVWVQSYSSYSSYGIRPDFGTEQSLPDRAIIARVTSGTGGQATGIGKDSGWDMSIDTEDPDGGHGANGNSIGYHRFSPKSTVIAGSVWLKDEKLESFYSVSLTSPTARARIWGPEDKFYD